MQLPIYMDYSATTPVDQRVLAYMIPWFHQNFGNAASRNHKYGWEAQEAVELAREQVARLINANPVEIIFTSGATEAVNLAIKGVYEAYAGKGNHIITAVTEHKAVLDTCSHLEKMGADVTYLPVDAEGMISIEQLEAAIRPSTLLICLMYANNETGVVHPVSQIGLLAKARGVLFFTDATQAIGKIPVDVIQSHVDLLALSAHKFYGPKGIGALYVRRRSPRVKLGPQLHGGGHERGMRSGTLNVPAIAGLGKAAELALQELEDDAKRLQGLRDILQQALTRIPETWVNGSINTRLPHVLNIGFRHVEAEQLMMQTNKTVAVATASACSSASLEPSYVLKALGLTDEMAYSSLRFSLGKFTTEEEVDFVAENIRNAVIALREASPLWKMENNP